MQKLDKKQIPQFVGLCVLSGGMFGYFALRMITPSPAAAATRPTLKPVIPTDGSAAVKAAPGSDSTTAEVIAAAPPPTPGMRDPFLVGYHETKATPKSAAPPAFTAPPQGGHDTLSGSQMASAQIHEIPPAPVSGIAPPGLTVPGFPSAPPLPAGVRALPPQRIAPPPPAPPKWSVTGLLQGEDGAGLAILRDGDSRRIVHVGDFVDGVFRVTAVTRSAVVLRHGTEFYTLSLGTKSGDKSLSPALAAPVIPAAPAIPEDPATAPDPAAPPAPILPRQSQGVPAPARRQWTAALAGRLPLRLLDGTEMAAETAPEQNPEQKIASLIR